MAGALNATLREALARIPNALIFGEDVEDPKGGVFGFTKGLSTRFPGRVVNSPLAEATIAGMGVGLAATGFRPILEMQFIDFIAPAFNQLLNQAATLRWRSNGDWTCPAVFYAPYGAYLPAGSTWHSQSNEGFWTHIPGLRVAVPSTPADLAGLLWSALQESDPTLLLIPKHIMRVRHDPVTHAAARASAVRASCNRGPTSPWLTWGNCLEVVQRQQRTTRTVRRSRSSTSSVWCHAIGRRSTPRLPRRAGWWWSLKTRTGCFGQAIITEVVGSQARFNRFLSAAVARGARRRPHSVQPRAGIRGAAWMRRACTRHWRK